MTQSELSFAAMDLKDAKPGKIYFPDLDGWRFVAFLGVFYFHAFHSFHAEIVSIKENEHYRLIKGLFLNGNLGVDFFFVLSGFLIIYLIISERQATGKIDIVNFYIRRILRIFPLYYACLFLGFVIFPYFKALLAGGAGAVENADWRYYVVFLGNLNIIQNNALPDPGTLAVLWSVAVEEQFYLTVPFILIVLPTRFYPWMFCCVIVFSVLFRLFNLENSYQLDLHTFSFVGNLAVGGLIAYLSIMSEKFVSFFQELGIIPIAIIYVCVILVFFFRAEVFANPILKAFSTITSAILFGLLILEQTFARRSLFKMRNNQLFSRLGKYTYGLYCLHMIAAVIVLQITSRLNLNTKLWQILFIELPLMLLLSMTLAFLSYQLYERPFLKLKQRFSFQTRYPS